MFDQVYCSEGPVPQHAYDFILSEPDGLFYVYLLPYRGTSHLMLVIAQQFFLCNVKNGQFLLNLSIFTFLYILSNEKYTNDPSQILFVFYKFYFFKQRPRIHKDLIFMSIDIDIIIVYNITKYLMKGCD